MITLCIVKNKNAILCFIFIRYFRVSILENFVYLRMDICESNKIYILLAEIEMSSRVKMHPAGGCTICHSAGCKITQMIYVCRINNKYPHFMMLVFFFNLYELWFSILGLLINYVGGFLLNIVFFPYIGFYFIYFKV